MRSLGLAVINRHTKFEVSTFTRNVDNYERQSFYAKYKNSRFEPPFGRHRGNAQGSSIARWKAHCRLPISYN